MSYFVDKNYYELLEISPAATSEEVKNAFQRAKNIYSPDSPALYTMFTPAEAKELSKILDEAYGVLSNYARRREYDRVLAARGISGFSNNQAPAFVAETELPDFFNNDGSIQTYQAETASANVSNHNHYNISNELKVEHGFNENPNEAYTRFSKYQVEPILEAEIKNQEVFDGSFLKKVRMYKNIDLDRLCEVSKIGKHHLCSIENNEFDKLPAKVFVRGFVKQYADVLQLDTNKVVDSYMKLLKESRGDK